MTTLTRVAVLFGYIGTHFFGSQYQPDKRTVEGEFLSACNRCHLFSDAKEAGFRMAGRTDRGVHATGQVASFLCDEAAIPRVSQALTWQLPPDIWIRGWCQVATDFHPRHAARHRTYRYYFTDYIDSERFSLMQAAALLFIGTHNFGSFSKKDITRIPIRTIRDISLSFSPSKLLYMDITAENYLWHMVRCIAFSLSAIGAGVMKKEEIIERLSGVYHDHVSPASADGLILTHVACDLAWEFVKTDLRSCSFLERERQVHMIMTEVVNHAYEEILKNGGQY
jgi:tRNA pseudouridine38-40 synthase